MSALISVSVCTGSHIVPSLGKISASISTRQRPSAASRRRGCRHRTHRCRGLARNGSRRHFPKCLILVHASHLAVSFVDHPHPRTILSVLCRPSKANQSFRAPDHHTSHVGPRTLQSFDRADSPDEQVTQVPSDLGSTYVVPNGSQ